MDLRELDLSMKKIYGTTNEDIEKISLIFEIGEIKIRIIYIKTFH